MTCSSLTYVCMPYVPLQSDAVVESVPYTSPLHNNAGVYLAEHFDNPSSLGKKWIKSNSKKPDVDEELAQYDGKYLVKFK